jgi:hypothetical protein
MSIVGLTDRRAAFPTIGKVRKGGVKTGNAPGKDLDYFRFTSTYPGAEKAFIAAYGEQPKELPIWLIYDTVEENFSTWMEEWKAGSLVRRCDGEKILMARSGGSMTQPMSDCLKPKCGCKPVGRLTFLLKEMLEAGFIGTVSLETHSINDVMRLTENLLAAEALQGSLKKLPLTLHRVKTKVSTPKPGSEDRASYDKWLLAIHPTQQWVQKQFAPAETELVLPMSKLNQIIGAPDDQWLEEPDEVEETYEVEAQTLPIQF